VNKIDRRSGQRAPRTPEPVETAGGLLVDIPVGTTGKSLYHWLRTQAADRRAKVVILHPAVYNDFRSASKQRSSSISWANGCGLAIVKPGKTVNKEQVCFL
jgi:hypothetical protein